jgi:molecular chaperone DnaJ
VEVETISGKARLKIPAGTQTDTVFRLKGEGMPSLRSGRKGDMHIKVVVKTPTGLSDKQKKLLMELEGIDAEASKSHDKNKNIFEKIGDAFK